MFLPGFPHIRKRLRNTMIRYSNSRHAPIGSPLYHSGRIRQGIEVGKPCMQMEFHTLDFSIIPANCFLSSDNTLRIKHHIVIIFGIGHIPVNREMIAGVDSLNDTLIVRITQEPGDAYGVGAVSDVERQYSTAALCKRS